MNALCVTAIGWVVFPRQNYFINISNWNDVRVCVLNDDDVTSFEGIERLIIVYDFNDWIFN